VINGERDGGVEIKMGMWRMGYWGVETER